MKDVGRLQQQVKAAWDKLPLDVKAKLGLKITAANAQGLAASGKTIGAVPHPPHRELLMLHSLLNDPTASFAKDAAAAPQGLLTHVGADGQVYFGGVDYDSTDIGWAYCFPAMVFTDSPTPPPFAVGKVIPIPDNTTLALLGDWGGWNAPAQSIAAAAKSSDYLIHLGDVYYAGTMGGGLLDPYEPDHFTNVWPGAAGHSFALNSNHDMYAHATGYASALTTAPFKAQGGNCFALYNKAFRIVGLDSAYYAPDNAIENFPGYMIGSLGPANGPQMQFLQSQISQLTAGQKLILLTHHNGLNENGSLPAQTDAAYMLWQQVTQAVKQIPAGASKNVVWYFGHVHIGAVYKAQSVGGVTIYPRCCGHSCIPWGIATELHAPNVVWFEQKVLGPGQNYFVTNGYATLALNGPSLTETFLDQNGKKSWSGTVGV